VASSTRWPSRFPTLQADDLFTSARSDLAVADAEVEHWDPSTSAWAHVSGTLSVTDPDPDEPDRRRARRILVVFAVMAPFIGLGLYFIPGTSGSPAAGHTHHLGWAIESTGLLLCIGFVVMYLRLGRGM
jgi:hypothetical protein